MVGAWKVVGKIVGWVWKKLLGLYLILSGIFSTIEEILGLPERVGLLHDVWEWLKPFMLSDMILSIFMILVGGGLLYTELPAATRARHWRWVAQKVGAKKATTIADKMIELSQEISTFLTTRQSLHLPMPQPSNGQIHLDQYIQYEAQTMNLYRTQFSHKVTDLFEEAKRLGYEDPTLEKIYQFPTSQYEISVIKDRLYALGERIKR